MFPHYLDIGTRKIATGFGLLLMLSLITSLLLNNPLPMAMPLAALVGLVIVTDFRPLYYLLFLATPFSIEAAVSDSLSTDLPTEPLMLLLTGVMFALAIIKRKQIDWSVFRHPIVTISSLILLWISVCTIFSVDLLVSAKWLAAKIWYLTAFGGITLLVVRKPRDFRPLFWLLYIPTFAIVIAVLIQHAQRGFSFAEVNLTVAPFFRNHVNYAVYLALFYPFIWLAATWYPKWSWPRIMANLGKLVILAAIYFSYTRSSWISVTIGLLAYFAIKHGLLKATSITALGALLISVGFLLHNNRYLDFAPDFSKTIYHENFEKHMEATTSLEDVSSAERIYRWVAAWNMFEEKPLTGFGPGTFYPNYKNYTVSSFYTYISENEERSTTHNYYLEIISEQGLIGLVLWFSLILITLFRAQNIYNIAPDRESRLFALALTISIITVFVNIFFSDLIEADKIGTLFWADLAMLVSLDFYVRRKAVRKLNETVS